ncbi:MAG: GumC family protein, partial [Pseudomonadota bacterium]
MSASRTSSSDADIDIARLFGALWRDKWKILLVSILVGVLAAFAFAAMTPSYRADSRVVIEENETFFTRPQDDNAPVSNAVDLESVASQVEIITSTDLLARVAEEIQLANFAEFDETKGSSIFKEALITFGFMRDPKEVPVEARVLAAVREKLEVYAVQDSRVIVIEFTSASADLASRFPNALAQAYVDLEGRARLESTGDASRFLEAEIEALRQSVRTAEERVEDFRSANGLFLGQNDEVLATQQLSELSTQLSGVRADRSSLNARVRSLETALSAGAALDTLPDVIASPLVSRLTDQRAQLSAQQAD